MQVTDDVLLLPPIDNAMHIFNTALSLSGAHEIWAQGFFSEANGPSSPTDEFINDIEPDFFTSMHTYSPIVEPPCALCLYWVYNNPTGSGIVQKQEWYMPS